MLGVVIPAHLHALHVILLLFCRSHDVIGISPNIHGRRALEYSLLLVGLPLVVLSRCSRSSADKIIPLNLKLVPGEHILLHHLVGLIPVFGLR